MTDYKSEGMIGGRERQNEVIGNKLKSAAMDNTIVWLHTGRQGMGSERRWWCNDSELMCITRGIKIVIRSGRC